MDRTIQHHGPELSPEICRWLDAGGPFPAVLTVILPSADEATAQVAYEILDRDTDGSIDVLRAGGRRGHKGFVLRVADPATGQQLAAKLCIPSDYDNDDHSPLAEAESAGKLRNGGEEMFLLPRQVGRVRPFDGQPHDEEDSRPWVCFVSDWVDGNTLQGIIERELERVSPGLVMEIAETLLRAVLFLELRGLKHDDLHLGNLMLVQTDPDTRLIDPRAPEYSLKVIDLGSLKRKDRLTHKQDDDWSMLARCLAQLHNLLYRDRGIVSRYPQFLRRLHQFIQNLSDEDLSRHFPDPGSYLTALRDVGEALAIVRPSTLSFHPFEAISAEHLANDRLLLNLFVDHLPWISLVQTAEPTVLIGPRGCGKSMVFRYLGLRTHLTSPDAADVLQQLGFFGVYIGCASDLGNDLLWISREQGRPERWADSITTYFNLVLARELLRSLAMSAGVDRVANALGITDRARFDIAAHVQEQLPTELNAIRLQGMDPLQTCADLLDRLRLKLGNALLEEQPPSYQLPPTFIRDLCQRVIDVAPGFADFRIVFLLDDYTAHRLSPPIQQILNTVLWQRSHTHVFKVSSEPHGFNAGHVDGARIDAHREYVPVDAGELSIAQEEHGERRRFISHLIDKRLKAAEFSGRVKSLIGDSAFPTDPALAEEIRAKHPGQRSHYHGIHVLSNAWSGDVATVLHMVREMFARSGVTKDTVTLIPPRIQHQSIIKVSTALRERVLGYHPFGEEMAKVLKAYGELCRKLLVDAPEQTNRSGEPTIHRKYRFEMTLPAGVELESVLRNYSNGTVALELMRELVRRAIFIELAPSRGKEGHARRTLRWQLRSSFLPSFGTSLIRDHYIDLKRVDDFVELLMQPETFLDKTYSRYGRVTEAPASPGVGSLNLFADLADQDKK